MGDVFLSVKLVGMTARGVPSAKGGAFFDALVDTGAARTIVSTAVARRVGIRPLARGGVSGIGGVVSVDVGAAYALVKGCGAERIFVGISDEVTEAAGAPVVLGHDYLQRQRLAVIPFDRKAVCRPKRTAAKRPAGKAR